MSEPTGRTTDCVFCAIISGDAPATIVAEWADAIAIAPLNPVTPGHLLVIPRRHVTDAAGDPDVTAEVMLHAAYLARDPNAANIITSIGADATQTVFHLHIHVVPRQSGDGLPLPWTGQIGRTTDHANELDSSHGGEHGRCWRLSLEFGAADDRQAHRLADAWADTAAREWSTRNPIVTSVGGEQRDRIAAILVARRTNGLCPLNGPCEACDCFDPDHRHERDDADAVVAALPELAELDRLHAEVTRLTNRLTALEATSAELLARAETAERERDAARESLALWKDGVEAAGKLRDQAENRAALYRQQAADEHARAEQAEAQVAALQQALADRGDDVLAFQKACGIHLPEQAAKIRAERDTAQAAITAAFKRLHSLHLFGATPEQTERFHREILAILDAALTPPSAPESPATAPTPPHPTHEPHHTHRDPQHDRQ